MTKFTQKYAIIQLFEPITEGAEWDWQAWPLHSTIADVFAVDWDETTLLIELAELPNICTPATSTVVGETYFGPDKQTHVMLLDKTPDLTKLHLDVVGLLKKGGWKPNNPEFAEDGFLPHSTVQSHARLNIGDTVTFDALALIDMFPGGDPHRRKLLKTHKNEPIKGSVSTKLSNNEKSFNLAGNTVRSFSSSSVNHLTSSTIPSKSWSM